MKYLLLLPLILAACDDGRRVEYAPDPVPIFAKYQNVVVPKLDFYKLECTNTGFVLSYKVWDGEITYTVHLNNNNDTKRECHEGPFTFKEKELKAIEEK